MLTLFWDSREPILEHYQEMSVIINSEHYIEMLHDKLKPVVRSKCRRYLSKCVMLLHDNASPHAAEILQKVYSDILEHSSCSPDLAPSDFHLFKPFRDVLSGCHLASDHEFKEAVHTWIAARSKTFFFQWHI
jgi:hypothetical protein